MNPPYQYIVVHEADRAGVLAVQAVHAATESLRSLPVSDQTRVIVLVAKSSTALEMLHVALGKAGIHHAVIREDKEPYKGVITAIGVEPQARELVQPHVADFKALR